MRVWKDKAQYIYPNCQKIAFQITAGRKFRLTQYVRDIPVHMRYVEVTGLATPCLLPVLRDADGDFMHVLNVMPKPKTLLRKALAPLNFGRWEVIIPLMHKDGPTILIEVAKLCEMTPIGPVTKLRFNREIPNGQNCGTEASARVEAGSQAQAPSNREGIQERQDGGGRQENLQDREVREQVPTPPREHARCATPGCALCGNPGHRAGCCGDSRCAICGLTQCPICDLVRQLAASTTAS